MGTIVDQVLSKKMGVAVVAMVILWQMGPDQDWTKGLIVALAAVHIICQTILDAVARKKSPGQGGKGQC